MNTTLAVGIGLTLVLALVTAYEMAIFSARPEHMRSAAQHDDRRGTIVMQFLRCPTRIISGLQIVAIFCNLVLGAMVQPSITPVFERGLAGLKSPPIGWSDGTVYHVANGLALALVTVGLLVVTNLIPKRIAYAYADELSLRWARPMAGFARIMLPLTEAMTRLSDGILTRLRVRLPSAAAVTEDDVRMLLLTGFRRGTINEAEMRIMQAALRLSDLCAIQIMTPADRIQWLDSREPRETLRARAIASTRSVLLYGPSLREVVGSVRTVELLSDAEPLPVQPVLRVSPVATALDVLEAFENPVARLAVVEDERGKVLGLISFSDLVRTLVGDKKIVTD
ncbi:MAG: CNNM domain-containing protein [Fimbriimonadaceae bacterium]|nr:CNNM domain-containing protein [Fimbriimonadaceae bacterium]